jgi:hypothetical protein
MRHAQLRTTGASKRLKYGLSNEPEAIHGSTMRSWPLAEGDASAASARAYQHIMGADPVKEYPGKAAAS